MAEVLPPTPAKRRLRRIPDASRKRAAQSCKSRMLLARLAAPRVWCDNGTEAPCQATSVER